jgi:hypothetical protein
MNIKRRTQPGTLLAGAGMLLIGALLLAPLFGLPDLSWSRLWPVLLIFAGIALLSQNSMDHHHRSGVVFLGTVVMLSGLFLSLFTFQIGRLGWVDMTRYWPVFPAIVGAGFLAVYFAGDMQNEALLKPSYLIGGFGLFLLPFTVGVVGGQVFQRISRFWPVLLIPVAGLIMFQAVRVRNRRQPRAGRE